MENKPIIFTQEENLKSKVKKEALKNLRAELSMLQAERSMLQAKEELVFDKIIELEKGHVEVDGVTFASMFKESGDDMDKVIEGLGKLVSDGTLYLSFFKPDSFGGNVFGWSGTGVKVVPD